MRPTTSRGYVLAGERRAEQRQETIEEAVVLDEIARHHRIGHGSGAKRTPLHRSQTKRVPGARLAEQAGIARIRNASNLGSRFRYHTRLSALDWIMSAFGFALFGVDRVSSNKAGSAARHSTLASGERTDLRTAT
jgi:hypothetical protein